MDELWDKFCSSGRIEDYLAYKRAERSGGYDHIEGSYTQRK